MVANVDTNDSSDASVDVNTNANIKTIRINVGCAYEYMLSSLLSMLYINRNVLTLYPTGWDIHPSRDDQDDRVSTDKTKIYRYFNTIFIYFDISN